MREKFTNEEINKNIFRQNNKEDESENTKSDKTIFTIIGKEEVLVDGMPIIFNEKSKFAYAKKENNKFYIKSNGSQLYDPTGLYGGYDPYKRVGDESFWKWRQVNSKTFDFFVRFLKTKNKSYYLNAARETFI